MSLWQKPIRGTQLNRSHPLARGLELCLPMWEGTGGTVYDVTNGSPVPTVASPTWAAGERGASLVFDGTSDYLNPGALPRLNSSLFTATALVRDPVATGSPNRFVFIRTNTNAGTVTLFRSDSTDKWRCSVRLDGDEGVSIRAESNFVATAGEWVYLAVVFDGATITLYRDGLAQESTAAVGTADTDNYASFFVGQHSASTSRFLGDIAHFSYYSRALSADEIAHLYANPWDMFETSRAAVFPVAAGTSRPKVNATLAGGSRLVGGGLVA